MRNGNFFETGFETNFEIGFETGLGVWRVKRLKRGKMGVKGPNKNKNKDVTHRKTMPLAAGKNLTRLFLHYLHFMSRGRNRNTVGFKNHQLFYTLPILTV